MIGREMLDMQAAQIADGECAALKQFGGDAAALAFGRQLLALGSDFAQR